MVILLGITVSLVRFTTDGDRVRGAASQIQSMLQGARDRAIYAGERRGVRFFLDPLHDPNGAVPSVSLGVSSMAYINPDQTWDRGEVILELPDILPANDFDNVVDNSFDLDGDSIGEDFSTGTPEGQARRGLIWVIAGDKDCQWWELKRRGLLFDGIQIELPKDSGNWYPVRTHKIDLSAAPRRLLPLNANDRHERFGRERLVLQVPYAEKASNSGVVQLSGTSLKYRLRLPPQILSEQPVILPDRCIVDVLRSRVPGTWRSNGSQYMDVVFSPRGNIVGDAAARMLHLYVSPGEDALTMNRALLADSIQPSSSKITSDVLLKTPLNQFDEDYVPGDRRIVTVVPQTGKVSVHEVNTTDINPQDSFADNPYLYAESGKGAKQ